MATALIHRLDMMPNENVDFEIIPFVNEKVDVLETNEAESNVFGYAIVGSRILDGIKLDNTLSNSIKGMVDVDGVSWFSSSSWDEIGAAQYQIPITPVETILSGYGYDGFAEGELVYAPDTSFQAGESSVNMMSALDNVINV